MNKDKDKNNDSNRVTLGLFYGVKTTTIATLAGIDPASGSEHMDHIWVFIGFSVDIFHVVSQR